MTTFLYDCVEDLCSRGIDTKDICVILPGKRAGTFLLNDFAQIGDKPMFLPQVLTINDFFQKVSGLVIADEIVLVAKLYLVYIKNMDVDESFDEFVSWGTMLLNDFNDIDKYLVKPDDIFSNIESIKELDKRFAYLTEEQISLVRRFWGMMAGDKLSKEQESLHKIWEKLLPIYLEFNQYLADHSMAYEGMAYRRVIDVLKETNLLPLRYKLYVVIGFNALNECEKFLFSWMKSQDNVLFYWDTDPMYLSNTEHEAGLFLGDNLKKFPGALPSGVVSRFEGKHVEIFQCPSAVAQAKQVPSLLSQWIEQGNKLSDCAIILCDESLLLPLLHSLPPWVDKVNITMGFPLKVTPAASLVSLLVRLQSNASRGCFLFADISEVARTPLLCSMLAGSIDDFFDSRKWHQFDKVSQSIVSPYAPDVFHIVTGGAMLVSYLKGICQNVAKHVKAKEKPDSTTAVLLESFFSIYTGLCKIEMVLSQEPVLDSLLVTTMLINQMLSSSKVSFVGEPLQGLQIMGILESRVLDFKKVIMLSVNEGHMPSSSLSSSYIPFNLRQGFGLPTVKQRDAIYAYYFFRLLHRADSASLAYVSGGGMVNEKSRYLSQILYGDIFKVETTNLVVSLDTREDIPLFVEKTPAIIKLLEDVFCGKGKGFSAKALNTYIDCRLKFYYQYVRRIKPEELVDEIPSHITFGNLFHKSMQLLYQPYVDMVLEESFFTTLLDDITTIKAAVKEAFVSEKLLFSDTSDVDGYYEIIFNAVVQYVKQTIYLDSQLVPLQVRGLEFELPRLSFPVEVNETTFSCNLYGLIDRVDATGGTTRVVDYKTGKKDSNALSLESLFQFDADVKKRNSKVFQALYYSFLYKVVTGDTRVRPELVFVRESAIGQDTSVTVNKQVIDDISSIEFAFSGLLTNVLTDVFNKDIPFTQNEKACEYCDFILMCAKTKKPAR